MTALSSPLPSRARFPLIFGDRALPKARILVIRLCIEPKTRGAMPVNGAGERIRRAVASWAEIGHRPHRFGGVEFRVGHREVGHVHGDSLVDIPFPLAVRDELLRSGSAEPHHVLPQSGWVSVHLRSTGDVERAIELLRRSYEIALAAQVRDTPIQ